MNSVDKRNAVKDNYDKIANQYANEYGIYIEDLDIYEEFEKELKPEATILDLGAGTGRTYKYFHDKGFNYIGLDFSKSMKDKAFELHGEFNYILDDMVNIKNHFIDNSIDAVFAVYSLFHLPTEDLKSVLLDIKDILKQNGIVLLSCSLGNGEKMVDEPYLGDEGNGVLYMNYITREGLYDLLNVCGYDIIYEKTKHEDGTGVLGEDGNDAIYIIARKK